LGVVVLLLTLIALVAGGIYVCQRQALALLGLHYLLEELHTESFLGTGIIEPSA